MGIHCADEFSGKLRNPDLPAGVCQADLEASRELDATELWEACDERRRDEMALQFGAERADELRDLLLDAEEGSGIFQKSAPDKQPRGQVESPGTAQILGRAVWRAWAAHRDQSLGELYRRGHIGQ
jgi:hypothetical protein